MISRLRIVLLVLLQKFTPLTGLYDRDYMREPQNDGPPPFKRPPTIVIVGGLLALIAFGFVVLGR